MSGVFITGTDTGVGKTLAACALIHALRARGVACAPMKPIAAGAVDFAGRPANEDTVALMHAAQTPAALIDRVTPVLLRDALAPHIAAQREGREITLDAVLEAFRAWHASGAFLVVEGVGGFMVPLGRKLDTVDLARAFGLPVVLVVGLRLGCLNHALLTAAAIRHEGLRLAGWIGSSVDARMAARDENVAALKRRLGAPCLGVLPHATPPDARELSAHLDTAWLPT